MCVNTTIIENRLEAVCKLELAEIETEDLACDCNHKRIYVCLEILVPSERDNSQVVAVLTLCQHMTVHDLTELQRLLVRLGVQIHNKINETQSISFLCRYHDNDIIDLMKTLVDRRHLPSHVCHSLIHQCQKQGTSHLIHELQTLLKRGVENIRIDCDSVNEKDMIVEDVANIFLHPVWQKRNVLSLFESCRTAIRINFNSSLYKKMVYHYNIRRHFNDTGFIDFNNTSGNTIVVPDFHEWQSLRAHWCCADSDSKELGRRILAYLDKHSHRRGICDQSPQTCRWCRVGCHVDDYLNRLMDKVTGMYPLFSIKQFISYGSSAEKTNILLANEFDRLVVLRYFTQSPSDADQIVYTGHDPAYVALEEDGDQQPINSSSLLISFCKAVTDALKRVYSVHVFAPTVSFGETCVTLHFLYRGEYPSPAVKVSVDITIAVEAIQQPTIISNGWFVSDDGEGVVLLVPHRKGVGNQWNLSYPKLERNMILAAGNVVATVYQLLKLLAALQHAKHNPKQEIPRKSSLSSYALKTCLFRYIQHNYRPPPWEPEDTLRHAVGILRQFPLNSYEMTSYFNKEIVVFNVTQSSKKAVVEIIAMLNKMM